MGLRNVSRWASYRRDMEASIGALNTTTLSGAGAGAAKDAPTTSLPRPWTHNKARDNDDQAFINQTDLTWKVATGAVKHTVTGGSISRWEKLERDNLRVRRQSGNGQHRGAVDRHVVPQPGHQRVARLHENPAGPEHGEGRHRRAVRAGPARVHAAVEGRARGALRLLRHAARKQTALELGSASTRARSSAPTTCGAAGPGLIWQPTNAPVVLHLVEQRLQPVGRARRLRRDVDQPQRAQPVPRYPRWTYNYEVGDDVGFTAERCACGRRSSASRRPTRAYTDPAGRPHQAQGKRRVDGVEFELAGSITTQWDVYAGLAYMDGQIIESDPLTEGKHMTVAPWSGSLWTVLPFLTASPNGWQVGGGTLRLVVALDRRPEPRARCRSYLTSGTRWSATSSRNGTSSSMSLNIFDEKYYVGGYQNNPNRVLPGQPLTGLFTLRYRFN